MLKKVIYLCLLSAAVLLCTGCTRNAQTDYSELERQLIKQNPAYAFHYDTLFFTDKAFYNFYSFYKENDMLFTAKTDEKNRITGVTLAMAKTQEENGIAAFTAFCTDILRAYVPPKEQEALIAFLQAHPLTPSWDIFAQKTVSGIYTASLITDDCGVCFFVIKNTGLSK